MNNCRCIPSQINYFGQYQNDLWFSIHRWVSRKNRIVVDYPEDNLILTGIRYNHTGSYLTYAVMKSYASAWNIPVVKAVDGLAVQNIELFVKQVREWESEEGVVVRFSSGKMVKVKADDYVLRHKSKDSISQEKNVLNGFDFWEVVVHR